MPQQHVERRLIKGRMHRLQHKIVFRIGLDHLDKVAPRGFVAQAIGQPPSGIRSPIPEVVVDVDRGNMRRARPFLKPGNARRDPSRAFKDPLAIREFEMIDDVDQQKCGRYRPRC